MLSVSNKRSRYDIESTYPRPVISSAVNRALVGTGKLIANSLPYAVPAMATALGSRPGQSAYSVRGSRGIDGGANTFQHDERVRYERKSMPARKKKAWKDFSRKVKHVGLQMQPLQIYTREYTANRTTLANQGGYFGQVCGGTATTDNDEIIQSFITAYSGISLPSQCAPYKLYIKSICLDIGITNTGSYPVILDAYTLKCRKPFYDAVNVATHWQQAVSELAVPPGGGSITLTKTALTPFDAPNFLSFWQVLRKREYIIGAGNTVTMQLRMPANQYVDGKQMVNAPQALRGALAFLFTWHGQMSNRGEAGAAQFDSTSLTFGLQKVVHYAVPPGSTTKEAGKTD